MSIQDCIRIMASVSPIDKFMPAHYIPPQTLSMQKVLPCQQKNMSSTVVWFPLKSSDSLGYFIFPEGI